MKTVAKSGLKVRSTVKAGSFGALGNHTRSGLKVRSAVKAGSFGALGNHTRSGLKVRSAVKAGSGPGTLAANHNRALLG